MQRRALASDYAIACIIAIALGCLVRARPVALTDFPLNDGGLFYQMTQELQRAHYRLPPYTGYNAAGIPFAYPPFGFYAAGVLADITPLGLVRVVQLLPLAVTCGTLVAFLLLARRMLDDRLAVVAAVAAFALVPKSFTWLVMGGGLTRSFGFLFTVLALHQAYLLFTRRDLRYAVSAGVFTGLTPLSHLGTAPFLAASLVVFFVAYGRHARGAAGMAVIGLVAIAVSAPWWLTVVRIHGFAPFLAAGQTSGSILTPGASRHNVLGRLGRLGALSTGEPLFPVIGMIALLGGMVSVTRRQLALPVWWALTLALDVRAGETYATLPVSLLAGIGVSNVLAPLVLARRAPPSTNATAFGRLTTFVRENVAAVVVTAFLLVYGTYGAITRNADFGTEAAFLTSLSRDERAAMRWVATNTDPTSRFFVVPEVGWPADKVGEWFPVLAARPSVVTVQGKEWLPNGTFRRANALHKQARDCAGRDAQCLDEWADSSHTSFSHVLIPKSPAGPCCAKLRASLRSDRRYALVFDAAGASIFARRDSVVAPSLSAR